MNSQIHKHNFVIIKLIICLSTIIYLVSNKIQSFNLYQIEWLFVAAFLFVTSGFELSVHNKKIWFAFEVIICFILCFLVEFKSITSFLIVVSYLDLVVHELDSYNYAFLCYLALLYDKQDFCILFLLCTALLCLYYQNYLVIYEYQQYMTSSRKEEFNLKESIDSQRKNFIEEKKRESLYAENKILEERDKLFQQLHDQLGHSINGSVYQLEAAKVLLDKKPKDSEKILQAVIDNLRSSMDELRKIFRREKPSKKQMEMVQLVDLCKKCRQEYDINADFNISGDETKISDKILEVILDNTYEAVTNALKYSGCTKLSITITVMNQLVQCVIKDNGRGCEKVEEGMGIQGMKKRMRVLGGVFMIQCEIGFELKMLFPLS